VKLMLAAAAVGRILSKKVFRPRPPSVGLSFRRMLCIPSVLCLLPSVLCLLPSGFPHLVFMEHRQPDYRGASGKDDPGDYRRA